MEADHVTASFNGLAQKVWKLGVEENGLTVRWRGNCPYYNAGQECDTPWHNNNN